VLQTQASPRAPLQMYYEQQLADKYAYEQDLCSSYYNAVYEPHACSFNSTLAFLAQVWCSSPRKSSPVTGLEWPRGFHELKVPRLHDNGTGWW